MEISGFKTFTLKRWLYAYRSYLFQNKNNVYYLINYYLRSFFFKDSIVKHYFGVKPGVIFYSKILAGIRDKVREIVAARLGEWHLKPVDALYDSHSNHIIPELWGYEVNLPETVDKIMAASRNEYVSPVYEAVIPDITIEDYPSAVISRGNPLKSKLP